MSKMAIVFSPTPDDPEDVQAHLVPMGAEEDSPVYKSAIRLAALIKLIADGEVELVVREPAKGVH